MLKPRIRLKTRIHVLLLLVVAVALSTIVAGATSSPAKGVWLTPIGHPKWRPTSPPPPISSMMVWLTPIGHPKWRPVDFHLFSAPIGTAESGYAEFLETALAILPPPNHAFHPNLGVGPGEPHPPPYRSEIDEGVDELGFHEGVRFNLNEFSNGMGVWLVWMNIPAPGKRGTSPDFASGQIIPNRLFPIHVEGLTKHNGKSFNPYLAAFDVPALDQNLDPHFDVDGHSHFPVFIADNADFGPPSTSLTGRYRFKITMTDSTGNGWKVTAHFVVSRRSFPQQTP